ncbi:MAG: hypothetical protein O7A04_02780 [Acidobacteria bacterium]|nr:hypothetical protein [Acidobacteriota bacterium]
MLPIVLLHGYGSEGRKSSAKKIYGSLPDELRKAFGEGAVVDINLSRWISLNDGIALDDVSLALERALTSSRYKALLHSGFHVVIHSTGTLVVRNWIRLYERKPSPIANLVHLAGAQFGSGLAHVGQGQLSRWGRLIFQGVGRGYRVLQELEFGSSKTLDLHLHFLADGNDMYDDYQVQEFSLIGSQTLGFLRAVPIRYVKEDSADNTVRTSASNLNFNYITVKPAPGAHLLSLRALRAINEQRLDNERLVDREHYAVDLSGLASSRREVPFTVLYETAHFGGDIGIVSGEKNRDRVMPLVQQALATPHDATAYGAVVADFHAHTAKTFKRVAGLRGRLTDWSKQEQYEAHAQIVFRIRDQFGEDVAHSDVTFKSRGVGTYRLDRMIEDKHENGKNPGTVTFYLRTQKFDREEGWQDLLGDTQRLEFEITGEEPASEDIRYLPLTIEISQANMPKLLQNFRTTLVDVTLLRLPSNQVLSLTKG